MSALRARLGRSALAGAVVAVLSGCAAVPGGLPAPVEQSLSAVPTESTPTPTVDPAPVCRLGRGRLRSAERACLEKSIAKGVRYLSRHLGELDPGSLMVLDQLSRRYDLAALAGSERLARSDRAATRPISLYARVFGPEFSASARTVAAATGYERLMGEMLSCEVRPVTAAVADRFADAVADGGYAATHALWSLEWVETMRCPLPASINREVAVRRVASDLRAEPVVDDLGLQQGVRLTEAGAAARIPDGWAAKVVAAQLEDGSWARGGDRTSAGDPHWHSTGLAVTYLLSVARPGVPDPGLIPAR